ncbi:MAG: helix-turn-helix domain-containing protein [Eubacterium sp.]|nr:helix-turn-helix domain-containing protein [Eubacterium sp.]
MLGINFDLKKTGDNIKRLREENSMNVKKVADKCGFQNPQSVYKWERGETLPSIDNLLVLAKIFDTSVEDILIYDVLNYDR